METRSWPWAARAALGEPAYLLTQGWNSKKAGEGAGAPSVGGAPSGFSLLELLAVTAIIGILAALVLSGLWRANARARRATCVSNLKQVNLGLRMYADDNGDTLPNTNAVMSAYKGLVKTYVGLQAPSSSNDWLFACPADRFGVDALANVVQGGSMHASPAWEYSSYGFNGLNRMSEALPGVAGKKLSSIHTQTRTILLAEISAFFGFSWHDSGNPPIFRDARSAVSFVDGHVDYLRIYWNGYLGKTDAPMFYDPPAGYSYQWSGNQDRQAPARSNADAPDANP